MRGKKSIGQRIPSTPHLENAGHVKSVLGSIFREFRAGSITDQQARTAVLILQAVLKAIEIADVQDAVEEIRDADARAVEANSKLARYLQ